MTAQKRLSKPEPPAKPELAIPREEAKTKLENRIKAGRDLLNAPINIEEDVQNRLKELDKWHDYNRDLLNTIFTTPRLMEEYLYTSTGSIRVLPFGGPPSEREKLETRKQYLRKRIEKLESIVERLDLIPLSPGVGQFQAEPAIEEKRELGNKVFLVHGHDEGSKQTVARFLEKLGLEAIILHEQASGGRTIIEKLEHYAAVDFAVIILTPDDIGASKRERDKLQDRARQNVILELGYFVGKIGRSAVCALYSGPMELPSDIIGVEYIPMDDAGMWKFKLGKELQAFGFPVDMNKI